MSFLRGSTDISNFRADLYALLSGTMAAGQRGGGQAGNGVTLSASDKWNALDGTNFVVRSQTTENPFTSEYALYRGAPRFAARATGTVLAATPQTQLGKPTFSGVYSGITVRGYFACFVSTANSSPGSLNGTVVTFTFVNADTGATVASGTVSGWTGASQTQLVSQGISLTLTLGPSDQFVGGTNAVMWLRGYTTTLTDGIDYFPEAPKIASGLVVSNSSGGSNNYTSGVDYDLVQQAWVFPTVSTTIGFFSAAVDWGGTGLGSGIHWDTGGSPPAVGTNYFVPPSYSVYNGYYQVPNVVSIGGNFGLTGAPMDFWDPTLGAGRWVLTPAGTPKTTINTTISYGQLFTGAAQAGTTFINFWISVKTDKIVMAFRGDTGQSGRLVILTLQRFSSLQSADDWHWVFIPDGALVSSQGGGGYLVGSKYNYENPYWGSPSVSLGAINLASYYGPIVSGVNFRAITTGIVVAAAGLPVQNPNNWDLRWWLYSIYLFANAGGSNLAGTFDAAKASGIRGKLQDMFVVATDNFTSLDELADASGTYLLATPTSDWGLNNQYDSLALLEA